MKRIVALTLLVTSALLSQTDRNKYKTDNPMSPPKETAVTINGKEIWIAYHAPSVRGRKIFGAAEGVLQPNNTIWRMGADQATFLHTDADLNLNGLNVPKGEYTLFIDLDAGKWSLIVNKQTGQWGLPGRLPEQDLGKTAMVMSKPSALVEQMAINLASAGGNKGTLKLEWENVSASVPFTVK